MWKSLDQQDSNVLELSALLEGLMIRAVNRPLRSKIGTLVCKDHNHPVGLIARILNIA